MPEDWRTLVDAHLYSINTSMVPEVIDLFMLLLLSVGKLWNWDGLVPVNSCFMQYLTC